MLMAPFATGTPPRRIATSRPQGPSTPPSIHPSEQRFFPGESTWTPRPPSRASTPPAVKPSSEASMSARPAPSCCRPRSARPCSSSQTGSSASRAPFPVGPVPATSGTATVGRLRPPAAPGFRTARSRLTRKARTPRWGSRTRPCSVASRSPGSSSRPARPTATCWQPSWWARRKTSLPTSKRRAPSETSPRARTRSTAS